MSDTDTGRPDREQRAGAAEIATHDSGYVWPIRASDVFAEDAMLCGASLRGGLMCIRRLADDLQCPRHGQRKATTRKPPTAPLPAVPDGEDQPCGSCGHDADHSGGECMWFDDVPTDDGHMQVSCQCDGSPNPDTDPDDPLGEHAPARLDAAADAIAYAWPGTAYDLRSVASTLRGPDAVEARAAVAAALARPTGDGQ